MGKRRGSDGPRPSYHLSVPLHYQIERLLRSQIESDQWAAGDRIPTEMEFVRRFKVSRTTIREALRSLERDGLIVRHRGRGTFVRISGKGRLPTLTNLIFGYDFRIRAVRKETVPAPANIAGLLGTRRDDPVTRFVRVELVAGKPLAVVINYMTVGLGRRIPLQELQSHSMLEILRDRLKVSLGAIRLSIEARMPDEEVAVLLQTDLAQPTLFLRLVVCDKRDRPVEVAETSYRADRYRYEVTLPRLRRSAPRRSVSIPVFHGSDAQRVSRRVTTRGPASP
jgi:GntR family transcriptional regulator